MSWWPNVWWLNVVSQNVGKPKGGVKTVAYLVANLVFSLSLFLSCSWTLSSWFWRELVSSSSPSPSVSARKIFLRVDSLAGCRHCSGIGCHPPANYFAVQPSSGATPWNVTYLRLLVDPFHTKCSLNLLSHFSSSLFTCGQFFLDSNHWRTQAMWKTWPQGVQVRSSPGASSSRQVEHCTLILGLAGPTPQMVSI